MKTVLICVAFAIAITGCESSKKVVANKPAAHSKFNDVPLTGLSLDAMEPSPKVYLTANDDKFTFNNSKIISNQTKSTYQGVDITRDTIAFPVADTLKRFKK